MPKPGPRVESNLDSVSPRTVSLDDLTVEMARVLGGSASRGIRLAVRYAYEAYQNDTLIPSTPTAAFYALPVARPAQPDSPDAPPE